MAEWKKVIVSGSNAELNQLNVGSNQQITTNPATTYLSGSFSGSFQGTANLPDLTHGEGIVPFTYDGATTATVAVSGAAQLSDNTIVKWNDTDGKFVNSNITDSGTLVTVGVDTQFNQDVFVNGDIVVQGTASFQNTENLLVADRFVLFASGSVSTGDGGIVVQQGTQNIGELYGYDSGTTRWGFTSSFSATDNSFVPAVYAGAVETSAIAPSAAPKYGGSAAGQGTIHVDTNTGDIYIYV